MKIIKEKGQVSLSEKQKKIIEKIIQDGKISIGKVSELNLNRRSF